MSTITEITDGRVHHGTKPKQVKGWMITNLKGDLVVYRRHTQPAKYDLNFSIKTGVAKLSWHGNWCDRGSKIRVTCFRKPTATGIVINIRLKDVDFPERTTEFSIHEGEMYVVDVGTDGFSKRLITLAEIHRLNRPRPLLCRPWFDYSTYSFCVDVQKPVGDHHPPLHCCTLYNDGSHLYLKHADGLQLLPFRSISKDLRVSQLPRSTFKESEVVFKCFGHLLTGGVVVSFRHLNGNWSFTTSIGKGNSLSIYDLHSYLMIK